MNLDEFPEAENVELGPASFFKEDARVDGKPVFLDRSGNPNTHGRFRASALIVTWPECGYTLEQYVSKMKQTFGSTEGKPEAIEKWAICKELYKKKKQDGSDWYHFHMFLQFNPPRQIRPTSLDQFCGTHPNLKQVQASAKDYAQVAGYLMKAGNFQMGMSTGKEDPVGTSLWTPDLRLQTWTIGILSKKDENKEKVRRQKEAEEIWELCNAEFASPFEIVAKYPHRALNSFNKIKDLVDFCTEARAVNAPLNGKRQLVAKDGVNCLNSPWVATIIDWWKQRFPDPDQDYRKATFPIRHKQLFIQGEPGCGKSTFCSEIFLSYRAYLGQQEADNWYAWRDWTYELMVFDEPAPLQIFSWLQVTCGAPCVLKLKLQRGQSRKTQRIPIVVSSQHDWRGLYNYAEATPTKQRDIVALEDRFTMVKIPSGKNIMNYLEFTK